MRTVAGPGVLFLIGIAVAMVTDGPLPSLFICGLAVWWFSENEKASRL